MIKFCPNCGRELKKDFKFCPSCGYNLHDVNEQQEQETLIECENCATENPAGNTVCKGCGIKLKGEVKTALKSTHGVYQQKKEKRTRTKERQPETLIENKEIDSKKIFGIIGAVLVGSFIILFAAGVFDKPVPVNANTNVNQNQNSGVDLSALQRINNLESTIKANPQNNEALLELAHLRNDSGMFEKAIENYQEYLNRVPENAEARIDMGVCYYNLGKYEEAISAMNKALEYSPNHQIGHLNLGIVNLASGNLEKSKEWLKKTVALGPQTEVGKRAQELLTSH
jgi:tetratricopeptide (TPR) repeat protein